MRFIFTNQFANFIKTKKMLTRKDVLKSIGSLPTRFAAEEAIERIVLLEKVRIGLEQSQQGKVVSKEEAKKRLKKWVK